MMNLPQKVRQKTLEGKLTSVRREENTTKESPPRQFGENLGGVIEYLSALKKPIDVG